MAAAKKKPKVKAKAPPKRERKPAEPKHEPTPQTRAIVERAALTGKLTHDDIGALIGVSDVTLRKYYASELRNGKAKTTVAVLNSFVKNCVGDEKTPGDVNAQKFYLERFAGMNAKSEVDLNAKVTVSEGPDLSDASDAELDALEALAKRMAGGASRSH